MIEGTTVLMGIPVTEKVASTTTNRISDDLSGVLVVDDEPFIRNLLQLHLQNHGFAVWLAANGQEAVDQYRQHEKQIHIVLLDVRMPILDGPQTLAALQSINPKVRCCFMTGHMGELTAAELIQRGALHVFQKPLFLADMVRVLREVVGCGAG